MIDIRLHCWEDYTKDFCTWRLQEFSRKGFQMWRLGVLNYVDRSLKWTLLPVRGRFTSGADAGG